MSERSDVPLFPWFVVIVLFLCFLALLWIDNTELRDLQRRVAILEQQR
jgi:hypothetical protein